MQFEEFALENECTCFCDPIEGYSLCSSTRTFLFCERSWTDIEPEAYSLVGYPVSKQLSTLLRHGHLLREEDGAFEFWRLKDEVEISLPCRAA